MPRQPKVQSLSDLLQTAGMQLKVSAVNPNVHGYEPHAKQELFHSSSAKGKLYIGGNRSGKTTGGVVEDCWWAMRKHPYRQIPDRPIEGRVIGVDFLNGIQKILLPKFAQWLPPSELIDGSWEKSYSKGDRVLTLQNGSFIEFMSYDQDLDKFAGTARDFTHYDEEPPQEIFVENSARLIDRAGVWWMTMTPVDGMTWVYDDVYMNGKSNPASNILVVEVEMTENPHLPIQEVEAFIASLDADDKAARVRGKFIQIGGLVYKKFDPAIHVIDPVVPPKEWAHYASCDHGYNNPTAWLWHAVSPDGQVITYGEHYESERTVDYHSSIVHSRNAFYERSPDFYVGDPAIAQRNGITGTSIQQEYLDNGIPLLLGNNDVLPGINRINQYLDPRPATGKPTWVVTRNCINLIREIQRLRFATYASKKMQFTHNKQDKIHKKDDHACDSARYFFSMLPDLRPVGSSAFAPASAIFPEASLGIDAFIPHLLQVAQSGETRTEWSTQYIDEYAGGEW